MINKYFPDQQNGTVEELSALSLQSLQGFFLGSRDPSSLIYCQPTHKKCQTSHLPTCEIAPHTIYDLEDNMVYSSSEEPL